MRSTLTRSPHVPFRTVGCITSTERVAIKEGLIPPASARPRFALGGLLLAALIFQLATYAWLGRHHALSDVPHLYGLRGIRPWAPPYFSRNIEYPVLIAFTMYVMSFAGGGAVGFFLAGAVISGSLAMVVAVLLERRGSPHLWRWVAGMPVFLFVFHNWDLLAIAPAVAGLVLFERGRNASAGVMIGLGAAAKLFPVVFLPPLVALRVVQGRPRDAARLAVSAAVVLLLLNLPVFIAEPRRWRWMFEFQGARPATWGSLWFYLLRLPGLHALSPPAAANLLSFAAVVIGVAVLTWLTAVRRLGAFEVGAAATAVFLLGNKVYSPGYDLWLVPFFAALLIARRWWVLFCVADLGVYFVVYGNTRLGLPGTPVRVFVCCFVLLRAVSIIAVIVTSVRRRMSASASLPDRQTAHR